MRMLLKWTLFVYTNLCVLGTLINGDNIRESERKPYIVYMGELPSNGNANAGLEALRLQHNNLLSEATGNVKVARDVKMHSFGRSFNGFVARLLPHEAKRLKEKKNVVSVFPNTVRKLHTTRSWDFLGMTQNMMKRNNKAESNLIVGLLDSGVWPDSPSFNDEGFGAPPSKWKGKCAKGLNFTGCNNKLIGATYYNLDSGPIDDLTPVDTDGHGTHTSSTAGGVSVPGASLYGIAEGTARGGVPSARIAMYKVCWSVGCTDMDLLAGFDAAIADGVDLISISIGGASRHFFDDPIAIGSFHAMKKGILTTCSAGNSGPDMYTVENVAPWIMTVAASSMDRQFETVVQLGNGINASGISVNTFSPKKNMYPLTDGAHAANSSGDFYGNASACDYGTMSKEKVKGKIVYCLGRGGQDSTIKDLGGAGTIIALDEPTDLAFAFVLPATLVNAKDASNIDHYINTTQNPEAVIHKSTTVNMTAPFVASFSSRGPQMVVDNLLKPDIAAPGLSILAAYSGLSSVSGSTDDSRYVKYNIMSGTSMACPHAAGAAAYIKTFHPLWSPAAIKSALMTTATPMKIKQSEAEFGSGSGQINPIKALDPGLVYDLSMSSYIRFLCKEGYNATTIALLTGGKKRYQCSSFRPARGIDGLNYPSMQVQLKPGRGNSSVSAEFHRIVTNVGTNKSVVYRAKVMAPKGLSITVIPNRLSFNRLNQKRPFKVVVKGKFIGDGSPILSGSLVWSDSKHHNVRSPIVVYVSEF